MGKFKIPIYWKNYGEIEVEAETLERAIRRVEVDEDELPLPDNWDLVEGSIEVSYELAEAYNPGHKLDRKFFNFDDNAPILRAKDFGIVDKEPKKVEQEELFEEMEARRHLDQVGEGYEQDAEDEGDDEEG